MKQSIFIKVGKWKYLVLPLMVLMLFANVSMGQQNINSSNDFELNVDINQSVGEMYPMWAYWGYDEPNYTYMADGRKLISELDKLSPGPVYYRAHSMLCTDEGPRAALKWGSTNAYTEDEQGNPVYEWTIIDKIVDTYIENGGKPMMEVGFMPKALSSNPEPYRHHWKPGDVYSDIFIGWAYPPTDYEKWAELIYQWVLHSVERYGAEEVSTWWWDVWNEPDIPYWMGTREEYFKLYDYTADAIKRALPTGRVGGPTTTNPGLGDDNSGQFLREFLEHCSKGTNYATGKKGTPVDFISFHAKGSPQVVDDGHHVQMNMGRQLEAIDAGFQIVGSFKEYKNTPIIIGESDPEGCAACSFASGYTFNGYRNSTMYASYTASSFARKYDLADKHGINFEGAVSWSFEFEDQPWFDGFRTMATNGIDKPVLNVFRMFGMMRGDRVAVTQDDPKTADEIITDMVRDERPDVHALASRQGNEVAVMVWNYHDDDLPAPDAEVMINIEGIPDGRALVHHYRIDDDHSNSYTVWQEMGAPQQVTRGQYKKLEAAGQLELLSSPKWIDVSNGKAPVNFSLPRQGVSLLQVTW
jgi:xylan 1,4-beta-xylosidase